MTRAPDADRYETLKRAVAEIGLIRRGTLLRRFMPCGKSGCRCHGDAAQWHGPYFQWTRKVHGKTVTVRVQPHEAKLIATWIKNGRRLNRLIADMERVSDRLTKRALRAARPDADDAASTERHDGSQGQPSPRRRRRERPK